MLFCMDVVGTVNYVRYYNNIPSNEIATIPKVPRAIVIHVFELNNKNLR